MRAPVTHRCTSVIYAIGDGEVDCHALRRADGTVEDTCGEPCSWVMGKSGYGFPPWEPVNGLRRDPSEPDAGFPRAGD